MTRLTGGRRAAAIAGLAPFVLGGVGAAVYPSPEPAFLAEPGRIAAFYEQNADAVLTTRGIFLITCVALVFFAGLLRDVLDRAEGGGAWLSTTAYGGALIGIAMLIVSNVTEAAAVLRADERDGIDPQIAAVAHDLSGVMFGLAAPVAFSVLVLATAGVAWRTGVLPRWHAIASAALGVTLALPMVSHVTMAGFPIWVSVTALVLLAGPRIQARRGRASTPVPA